MPLPCSPASMSTGEDTSTSQSQSATDCDSEGDLITPRPGPSAPEHRTEAALSRPVQPTAEAFNRPNTFKEWQTDNIRERLELSDEERINSEHIGIPPPTTASQGPSTTPATAFQFSPIATIASTPPASIISASSSSAKSTRPQSASQSGSGAQQRLKSKIKTQSTTSSVEGLLEPERRSVSFHPDSFSRTNTMENDAGASSSAGPLFSASFTGRISPKGSPRSSRHLTDEAESSADENTAIFRRSSGAKVTTTSDYGTSKAKLVNTVESHNDGYEGAGEEEVAGPTDKGKRTKPAGSTEPSTSRRDRSGEETKEREKWWRRVAEKYGSVELENKGSVARDHLALERTFLAWLRTSLSFASIGIAVTQLFRLNVSLQEGQTNSTTTANVFSSGGRAIIPADGGSIFTSEFLTALATSPELRKLSGVGKPLGATFLGVAILILFVGFHRYFESQHYVIQGKFPASRGSIMLVSFVAGALIIASLAVILSIKPRN